MSDYASTVTALVVLGAAIVFVIWALAVVTWITFGNK